MGMEATARTVTNFFRRNAMLGTILLVILVLMLLGAVPAWPHSRNWGYYPSGGLGLVALVLIVLLLMGHI
jgi:asparagine N-glycosylation enzyme membrane subunit Stt3